MGGILRFDWDGIVIFTLFLVVRWIENGGIFIVGPADVLKVFLDITPYHFGEPDSKLASREEHAFAYLDYLLSPWGKLERLVKISGWRDSLIYTRWLTILVATARDKLQLFRSYFWVCKLVWREWRNEDSSGLALLVLKIFYRSWKDILRLFKGEMLAGLYFILPVCIRRIVRLIRFCILLRLKIWRLCKPVQVNHRTVYGQPLRERFKEIMLLKVRNTQNKMCFDLNVVSLYDRPKYFALSYRWNGTSDVHTIEVNGHSVRVASNVFRFLQHLLHAPQHVQDVPFWIDAHCIN